MPKNRKVPVVRAWRAGSFAVVQVGRKAWQLAESGLAADMFGDDWMDTEFDAVRGPTFAKRRDKWIKKVRPLELPPAEARRLNNQRMKAMKGRKPNARS